MATLPLNRDEKWGMFEGFLAFLGSSEPGFPALGIVSASVSNKPILGTMARPQAKPSCNWLHRADPHFWANIEAYEFLWRLSAVI